MLIAVAEWVVVSLGIIGAAMSVWGMFVPERLFPLVRAVMENRSGLYVAVGVRLVIGSALIVVAPASVFPFIFNTIGAIAIVAAIAIPFIGRSRIIRMITWFERFPPAAIRSWLLFGCAFGIFLVYGIMSGPR